MNKLFLSAALIGTLIVSSARAQGSERDIVRERPVLHVTGTAKVEGAPDKIDVHLTISTVDESLERAMSANRERMRLITTAATSAKIAAADVQLASTWVREQVEYYPDERVKSRKQNVTKSLVLCLRDPQKLDGLLIDLAKAKVAIGSIEFVSDALERQQAGLQIKALQNAKSTADEMAKAVGAKVGQALRITPHPSTRYGRQSYSGGGGMNFSGGGGVSVGDTSTGALALSATVEVVFELLKLP